jgi:hypothetical protein
MSNLTDLLPAGAGGKQVSFVASGTLSSGQTVVLKTDGTVTAVAGVTEGVGSSSSYTSGSTGYITGSYDSINNKVVFNYNGTGNYGTAVVGTISGTSISFGTPVVYASVATFDQSGAFDTNAGKVLIAYRDNSNADYGKGIVGTVSGTSISFGTATTFNTAETTRIDAVYDSSEQKIIIAFRDVGNSQYGKLIAATISGTSVSFGAESTFNAGTTAFISITYDASQDKTLVFYQDNSNNRYPTCRVADLSGTSFSYGSETVVASKATEHHGSSYTTAGKHLLVYRNDGTPNSLSQCLVATVSGTSVSFGAEVEINAQLTSEPIAVVYDESASKVIIFSRDQVASTYYPTYVTGSISGTTVTLENPTAVQAVPSYATGAVYDPTENKTAFLWNTSGWSQGVGAAFTVGFN